MYYRWFEPVMYQYTALQVDWTSSVWWYSGYLLLGSTKVGLHSRYRYYTTRTPQETRQQTAPQPHHTRYSNPPYSTRSQCWFWGWREGEGNLRCKKSPLWCRLTYGEEFSKIKPSGHMYDTKCIFSAHIMCMVHTPFNDIIDILCFSSPSYESVICDHIYKK